MTVTRQAKMIETSKTSSKNRNTFINVNAHRKGPFVGVCNEGNIIMIIIRLIPNKKNSCILYLYVKIYLHTRDIKANGVIVNERSK